MSNNSSFTLPVLSHVSKSCIGVYVTIGQHTTRLFILNTAAPRSTLSSTLVNELYRANLIIRTLRQDIYRLPNLSAYDRSQHNHVLPDLTVRSDPRLATHRIEGQLGLDFFNHFELICFRRSTSDLLLEPRPTP